MAFTSRLCTALLLIMLASSPMADEIRFEGFPDYDSLMARVLPAFESRTGLEVDVLMNQWADHHRRIATVLATGRGAADVVLVDVNRIGTFVSEAAFADLTDRYRDVAADFPAYAVHQGQGADGRQYAVPVDLGPGVTYYRRDFMEDAGYRLGEAMASWKGYIDYGRWLRDTHGVLLIGNAESVALTIIFTEVAPGDGFYFDGGGELLLTSERFFKAFEIARLIRQEGLDGRISAWSEDWYEGFRTGRFATELAGAWLLGHLQNWIAPETAGQWGVSHLPSGAYGAWGGAFLAIPEQSQHKAEAWKLVSHMISRDTQLAGLKHIAAFPANISTYDDPVFDEPIAFLRGQRARRVFADIARNIEPVTPHSGDHVAADLVLEALRRVLDQNVDVQVALEDAERQVRRRLRLP
ncbi:MAG: sugar ABC transporter substrate-binding protein [unclassified Hahellaceae]|nr:sugar ABC transporter substrate-binding protein [Hahellaceae bacterium]